MTINARISAIREILETKKIDALIIPSSDPHQSEYLSDHWKSREWVSGFTGSAGTALITQNHAGLWTDSRYFLQAEQELSSSEFILHKIENRLSPGFDHWVCENLAEGSTVAIDGWTISKAQEKRIRKKLNKAKINLITHPDVIELVWNDRPALPISKAFIHNSSYSGNSAKEKIASIRKYLFVNNAKHIIISDLAELAWVLNIRGNDVEFNPVISAYLIISSDKIYLFIDEFKVLEILKYINDLDITIRPYDAIKNEVKLLSGKVIIDENICNAALYDLLPLNSVVNKPSFITEQKSIKNKVELENFRIAMVKDGIALAKAFYWLDQNIDHGVSEYHFGEKLAEYRAQENNYFGESFPAIVGFNGNGAIIHYRPNKESSSTISKKGILLCDSGAQFFEGTTDITRTFAFGSPTKEQKKAYTLVLKGHIGLAMAKFPKGTKGVQLDILARQPLWSENMNYGHGTGHGVGHFLNVHEGPQGFDAGNSARGKNILKAGMVTSNEPGFYKVGDFGIRIENLVITIPSDHEDFLQFETITLYPIQTKAIDLAMLSVKEIMWLNDYHALVWKKLSPLLDEEIKNWLKPQCSPI